MKDELKVKIREEITDVMEKVLDFSQVACDDTHYKSLRSKVLRLCNNAMRNLEKYVEENING